MANAAIQGLQGQVQGLIVSLDTALEKVRDIKDGSDEVDQSLQTARDGVAESGSRIGQTLADIEARSTETTKAVNENLDELLDKSKTAESEVSELMSSILNSTATALDDLKFLIKDFTDPITEELKLQIQLIELGIKKIEDLDNKFLQAKINGETVQPPW